jgi:predicted nucleic acid-binding Zn ribbon protein
MKKIEDIGSIIGSVVDKMELSKKLRVSKIFNHWEDIVGSGIAKKSKPQKLVRETLYVSVTTSTWANELSLMSEKLIEKINFFTGEDVVKTIRFKADL